MEISRLRSGHHPQLLEWRKKIGLNEEDTCRLCGLYSETNVHVICECRAISRPLELQSNANALLSNTHEVLRVWHKWREKVQE